MTFKEIHDRILPFWGETIAISDGMILEAKPPRKGGLSIKPQATSSFYSPAFSSRWNEAEEAVAKEDTFGKIMVWTMYQLFHRQARQLFEQGEKTFAPSSIAKSELEEQYFRNLQEDATDEEIALYRRGVE